MKNMKPKFLFFTIFIVSNLSAQPNEKIYELDYNKVDSVTLVEYTALIRYNREPEFKSYQPDMDSLERQQIDLENKKIKKKHEVLMNLYFPNRVEGRDMSTPPETIAILNKKGEFYPNVRWETYRTFPTDSVMQLLKILNCAAEIPQYILIREWKIINYNIKIVL